VGVVVVGSANMDLVAQVARIPGPGETLLATGFARGAGGKGANQAVAAARAGGARVTMVGAVGRDEDGRTLRAALESDGVDTSTLVSSDEPTGMALISVDARGENAIVVVAGANGALTELDDAQRAAVARAEVVLMQLEVPMDLLLDAARARCEGALLVLNAAPSAVVDDELLEAVDVLVVNEHEAKDLAGVDDLDGAVDTLSAMVDTVLVTLGAAGSLVCSGQERVRVAAVAAEAVDTTGAGDTFVGVLGARLAAGDSVVEAARWGAAAAALTVQRPGAQAAVPTHAETERALRA
jgi:ribokinase